MYQMCALAQRARVTPNFFGTLVLNRLVLLRPEHPYDLLWR